MPLCANKFISRTKPNELSPLCANKFISRTS